MKTLYISTLLLLTALLFTDRSLAAPSEAEFRKLSETWTLQNDGSQEYRCYKELTLFTHTAMNSTYGQTFITYNPEFQELKIHDAYVQQKNGTIVRTPENAFVEVLPQEAADAPAFNGLKEMVIVHTGLELGATIYLDYSIISKPGYLPEIDLCRSLQATSPIRDYTLTFNVPANKPVHYKTFQVKTRPMESLQNGYKQIQWKLQHLPASYRIPEIHLQNGDIPGLLFSTYPSVASALHTLYRQFDTPAQVSELASKLTINCKNDTEKLYVLSEFVRDHIDLCPLSPSATGYRLRPAAETVRSLYATGYEKINLLTNLLKAAGLTAEPTAVYRLNTQPDNCGLEAISELIVKTKAEGKDYYLNILYESAGGLNGNFFVNLSNGEKKELTPQTHCIHYKADMAFQGEEILAQQQVTLSNRLLPYRQDISSAVFSDARDCKQEYQADSTTIWGKTTCYTSGQNGYLFLELPEIPLSISRQSYAYYNSKRPANLRLQALADENYSYVIELPADIELCTPDKNRKINNPVGSLSISVKKENNRLYVNRSLKLKKQLVTPADYPAFRQLMTEWADPNGRQILFKSNE